MPSILFAASHNSASKKLIFEKFRVYKSDLNHQIDFRKTTPRLKFSLILKFFLVKWRQAIIRPAQRNVYFCSSDSKVIRFSEINMKRNYLLIPLSLSLVEQNYLQNLIIWKWQTKSIAPDCSFLIQNNDRVNSNTNYASKNSTCLVFDKQNKLKISS